MTTPELSDDVVLDVEVAYALPTKQLIIPLQVPLGTTVIEAVLLSGITDEFEGLDPLQSTLGIFGDVADPDQPLQDKQRVEIYRPLKADPREVRRQLAAAGKTMGNKK
ncbi:MAG: RnfH family protein [Gammaproteobacteria bacterium]|nr:RnfH family protein [Gammaproteobacteria bacterium]